MSNLIKFGAWNETKNGLIVDEDNNVIMSAAAFHASCKTIVFKPSGRDYGGARGYGPFARVELGINVLRKKATSHKTY